MPWKETLVPNERMKFIAQCEFEEESMAQLCRKYGISRKSGCKWWDRWQKEGLGGLVDRSRAVAGLSRLSIWWIKLGIQPERIEPGHPEQNGRHERMHLTLKQETASPPASTPRKPQQRFDLFCRQYNDIRPHEALGMRTPASLYEFSPRPYPRREVEVSYPAGWALRKVQSRGEFYWRHEEVSLSAVLFGETIGLEPVEGRYWRTYFGSAWLGVFDSHCRRMLTPAQLRRQPQLLPRAPQDRPSATLRDDPAEG
jgi:transposase-like protein